MGASFLARLVHRAESGAGGSGLESESQFGTTAFFGAQPRLEGPKEKAARVSGSEWTALSMRSRTSAETPQLEGAGQAETTPEASEDEGA